MHLKYFSLLVCVGVCVFIQSINIIGSREETKIVLAIHYSLHVGNNFLCPPTKKEPRVFCPWLPFCPWVVPHMVIHIKNNGWKPQIFIRSHSFIIIYTGITKGFPILPFFALAHCAKVRKYCFVRNLTKINKNILSLLSNFQLIWNVIHS